MNDNKDYCGITEQTGIYGAGEPVGVGDLLIAKYELLLLLKYAINTARFILTSTPTLLMVRCV